MRNVFVLMLFSLFLLACTNNSNTGNSVNSNGEQSSIDLTGFTVVDIPGTDQQRAVKMDPNGKVLEEGTLRNGMKNGTWITYHTDKPMPKTIANFVDNQYNGPYLELNNRGQIEKRMGYLNNALDGYYGQFKFGRTVETVNYKQGKMHGLYKSFFNNTDKIQKEINYKDGELDGNYKFYNEEGTPILEYVYKDGEKISGGVAE